MSRTRAVLPLALATAFGIFNGPIPGAHQMALC